MAIINDEGRTEYVPVHRPVQDLPPIPRHVPGWQPQGSLPGEGASRPDPRFASSDDVVTPYRPGPRPTAIPMPDPREAARAARIARRDAMMAMNMGSGGPKVGAYSSDPRNESYDPWTALNDHLKEAILAQEREQMKRSD